MALSQHNIHKEINIESRRVSRTILSYIQNIWVPFPAQRILMYDRLGILYDFIRFSKNLTKSCEIL